MRLITHGAPFQRRDPQETARNLSVAVADHGPQARLAVGEGSDHVEGAPSSSGAVDVPTVVHVEDGDGSGFLVVPVDHSICTDAGRMQTLKLAA
jgi:hypothetical protein